MKKWPMWLLLAAFLPTLQGCLPLVAGGVAGGVLVGADRRTTGVYVDDETIELKLTQQLQSELSDAHINVTSFNRVVLISGEVRDQAARSKVDLLARAIPNVRRVFNQTVVDVTSTIGNRLNDASLTSKVKARMVHANLFSPNHIKVISERGEVFLMGLVTPEEGGAAARIASETSGVLKVHALFEYIDPKMSQSAPVAPVSNNN